MKLDTVSIGDVTLNNIDAVVLESGLTVPPSRHDLPQPYGHPARCPG
ncbi:MAG: hypothetical protein HC807_04420 [Gammaproteobacteria bacterium]|nr:hypothetical protein [Gammaproteobacteria bacterium]